MTLISPDGKIVDLQLRSATKRLATVQIEQISPQFVGYEIAPECVLFNLKSTLAQLGLTARAIHTEWNRSKGTAHLQIEFEAIGALAQAMLEQLPVGAYVGKLFAADPGRLVREPDALQELVGRLDARGAPLLALGEARFEQICERAVAWLTLRDGIMTYDASVYGFLPTLAKSLTKNLPHTRQLLHLHHRWQEGMPRHVHSHEILLVCTAPLHIRTLYARVVDALLPPGYHHTAASVLQPDTFASGNIYELFGSSDEAVNAIPLEFYRL